MVIHVTLAGRVALAHDGESIGDSGLGRLGRLAVGYLVLNRHRPVTRDELAEVLWAENLPSSWATSLRVVVGKVRAWLAAGGVPAASLVTTAGGYQLELPGQVVVDVEVAQAAVDQAEQALKGGRPDEARRRATEAVTVSGRPFLGGIDSLWGDRFQARLHELRVQALTALSSACLADGDPAGARAAAEEALATAPLRESAHARLIAAHVGGGNRAEALRAYERCRVLLVEELGVGPSGEVAAAYTRLLSDDLAAPVAPRSSAPRPGRDLPAPSTTFIGRTEELAEVERLLGSSRLVTLMGTGGVGKTRLALAVASRRTGPVHLLELAPVPDPGLVPAEALSALGVAPEPGQDELDALAQRLGSGEHLLLLDNCEHVVEASAALVSVLLARCAGLTVLATSREPLRVTGEVTWRVPSLAPDDAVALFVDRARLASPEMIWPGASAPGESEAAPTEALAKLCRRLDGIPLALELAAARTRALSVDEIAERLDDCFRLLTGGARDLPARHQTLRAAVDWTYQALPAAEAALFDRLAVFANQFSLAAVEEVCSGGDVARGDVAGLLVNLVDRSLVLVERADGRTLYRLSETLRQYGRERLSATGAAGESAWTVVADRHLAWAMGIVAEAEGGLGGPDQVRWLEILESIHDDLRAALAWAREVGGEALPRLACGLGRFWEMRGHLSEGRAWLDMAASVPNGEASTGRAHVLDLAGILAQRQGDYAVAAGHYRASLEVHRRLGQDEGVAAALHGLGNLAALRGDLGEAGPLYEECLAIGRRLGHGAICAAALANLGSVAQNQGLLTRARSLFEESLAIRRALGDEHEIALLTGNLGYLAFQEGDGVTAVRLGESSLAMRRRLGDRVGTANALCNLGYVALSEGDPATARSLIAESLALAEDVGDRQATTLALLRLARVARATGDLETAIRLDRRAMPLATQLGAKRTIAEWLEGVAATATAQGDALRATELLAAADALRRAIGAPLPPSERAVNGRDVAIVRAALGDAAFAPAWARGAGLSLDQAIERASRA